MLNQIAQLLGASYHGECPATEDNIAVAIENLIAERDAAKAEAEIRTTMAARAQEALRYLMNGLPANDTVWAAYGNADSARAWLAERLAQQRREAAAEVWEQVVTLAHGCHDYGGGHTGDKYEAFQHGIDTVIRVLEAKRDGDDSLQIKVAESVGAAALRAGKVQDA